ncbi:hypothetical protein EIP86_004515 [Pleurotus ostreatoroseus]|nr:hypothetical protein EIP86_004515 [Pleurotus ostreatoroseus]
MVELMHGPVSLSFTDVSEHSHEIGLANLPYTKRGRKAAAEAGGRRTRSRTAMEAASSPAPESQSPMGPPTSTSAAQPAAAPPGNPVAGPSAMSVQPTVAPQSTALGAHVQTAQQQQPQQPTFEAAIMGIAPPAQPPAPPDLTQERWDRMSVLFQAIRDNARNFEYPAPSVAALESVLVRLYLESPMGGGASHVYNVANDLTSTHAGSMNGG